ncbi:MAG: hypothetical protein QOF58_8705 [Pseudonocardiales bacterium]|nr:hypothetical protein [Pseudonocardiales bacterium]
MLPRLMEDLLREFRFPGCVAEKTRYDKTGKYAQLPIAQQLADYAGSEQHRTHRDRADQAVARPKELETKF